MIIECTSCHARYQYDEDRFERKPSKKIKCAKCSTIFEIHNPAFAAPPKSEPKSADQTFHKRDEAKKQEAADPRPAVGQARDTGKVSGPQMPQGKRLSLAVINGPDAGSVYRIEKPRVTIGRTGADLALSDSEISRNHAAVEIRDTTYMVEDLKSTNGTLFEGEKISGLTEIQNHSEFTIGGTTLMLIVTEDV
ncbi:MAG: zinc-ribbon domain-containing protein [Acidobacteriota bacterium]|nr:zinc-ribbon domain-containing protein [Acidobacteriota bacterium]